MRVSTPSVTDERAATLSGGGYRDAESLFRTKAIPEIRNVESETLIKRAASPEVKRRSVFLETGGKSASLIAWS